MTFVVFAFFLICWHEVIFLSDSPAKIPHNTEYVRIISASSIVSKHDCENYRANFLLTCWMEAIA